MIIHPLKRFKMNKNNDALGGKDTFVGGDYDGKGLVPRN